MSGPGLHGTRRGDRVRSVVRGIRAELSRTNYAGRRVSLLEGAMAGAGVAALAARSGVVDAIALGGVAGLGLVDDILEPRRRRAGEPVAKGLRGHLGAMRAGRLTTGGAKLLGIPVLCLASAACAPTSSPPRVGRIVMDGALAAGCANLANLLDLRPGRALKAVAVPALALSLAAAGSTEDRARQESGRALALAALIPAALALPADLREHGMLGDGGANALGAAVGTALARRSSTPVAAAALLGVIGLTLASERVSFSRVIDATPWLAHLDALGRRASTGTQP